jgi:hypothetical protein
VLLLGRTHLHERRGTFIRRLRARFPGDPRSDVVLRVKVRYGNSGSDPVARSDAAQTVSSADGNQRGLKGSRRRLILQAYRRKCPGYRGTYGGEDAAVVVDASEDLSPRAAEAIGGFPTKPMDPFIHEPPTSFLGKER